MTQEGVSISLLLKTVWKCIQGLWKSKLVLAVIIACFGILLSQYYTVQRKEHKCKGTKPKSAESSSSRHPPDTEVPLPPSPSVLHVFQKTAVCSDSDVCSRIGRDLLQRGGNAVDSALAVLACNGLVTMQSMGIGGGFIMNVYKKSLNKSFTVMAREVAPSIIHMDNMTRQSQDSNLQGPESIAVPGEIMGYAVAHERFGSLSWQEILEPTIKICEEGFQLSKHQWDSLFFNPRVLNDVHLRKMFINETTGGFKRAGSLIHPPRQLCETYRQLARRGPRDLYTGELAKLLIEDLQEIGSSVSHNDLRNYKVPILDTSRLQLGSDILHLVPPVGSGVVVGLAMRILHGYSFNRALPDIILVHRIVEALKFAFAIRWKLGDPEFNDLTEILKNITSSDHPDQMREKINDSTTNDSQRYYGGEFDPVIDHGTGHISVLAQNGDAVSVTSTIHYYFGSAHMGKRTGVLFNSAIGDFSIPGLQNYFALPPSTPNLIFPNKRPMSSMAPTIVTDQDGNVKLIIGGAGGPKIISALVNILVRILWMGDDVKQAIDAPRFHHQLEPNAFEYEYGLLKEVVDTLESMGHRTLRYRERGSVFCGIMKNESTVYANVDFRKLGGVSGY